jgi:hypothetical protein
VEERYKYTANARRSGGVWSIDVPNLPGATCEARRLDQVPATARQAIARATGVAPDTFDLTVMKHLDPEVSKLIVGVSAARGRAVVAQVEASNLQRFAARELTAVGYTTRDVGTLLDLSHQRVAQLLSTPLESSWAASSAEAFGRGDQTVTIYEVGKGPRETTARELVAEHERLFPPADPPKGFSKLHRP